MILCPVAAVASCNRCPVNKLCLVKGIVGDDKNQTKLSEHNVAKNVSNSEDKTVQD